MNLDIMNIEVDTEDGTAIDNSSAESNSEEEE